jgi:uncharacterized membrane protein YebE (DUF533 family)
VGEQTGCTQNWLKTAPSRASESTAGVATEEFPTNEKSPQPASSARTTSTLVRAGLVAAAQTDGPKAKTAKVIRQSDGMRIEE